MIPDTDKAKVLIAMCSAGLVFLIALLTLFDADLTARRWMIHALLFTAFAMLGVDWIRK